MIHPDVRLLILLLSAFVLAPASRAEPKSRRAQPLIATQAGDLPIIISAPHGGTEIVPGVPERKGEGIERNGRGFVVVRDSGTTELAREIAAAIETRTGKKPYYVLAEFHRKYIDPNRPPAIAFEHRDAKPFYDSYHGALSQYAGRVRDKFGAGLLLDIHGQSAARDTIFRGTQNGATVALLVDRHGAAAHVGPKSFFGLLAAAGCKVHPTGDGMEQAGFTGGYIVQTYGGKYHFGLDAIQLEFGADYRAPANRKATAAKVADAVVAFSRLYLPAPAARK
jgi:N-formylglutamate amidohydrolase